MLKYALTFRKFDFVTWKALVWRSSRVWSSDLDSFNLEEPGMQQIAWNALVILTKYAGSEINEIYKKNVAWCRKFPEFEVVNLQALVWRNRVWWLRVLEGPDSFEKQTIRQHCPPAH